MSRIAVAASLIAVACQFGAPGGTGGEGPLPTPDTTGDVMTSTPTSTQATPGDGGPSSADVDDATTVGVDPLTDDADPTTPPPEDDGTSTSTTGDEPIVTTDPGTSTGEPPPPPPPSPGYPACPSGEDSECPSMFNCIGVYGAGNVVISSWCGDMQCTVGNGAGCPEPSSGNAVPACLQYSTPVCALMCPGATMCPVGMTCSTLSMGQTCVWAN